MEPDEDFKKHLHQHDAHPHQRPLHHLSAYEQPIQPTPRSGRALSEGRSSRRPHKTPGIPSSAFGRSSSSSPHSSKSTNPAPRIALSSLPPVRSQGLQQGPSTKNPPSSKGFDIFTMRAGSSAVASTSVCSSVYPSKASKH
jgi:hypothetical protein